MNKVQKRFKRIDFLKSLIKEKRKENNDECNVFFKDLKDKMLKISAE
jgi:hypothetical protein